MIREISRFIPGLGIVKPTSARPCSFQKSENDGVDSQLESSDASETKPRPLAGKINGTPKRKNRVGGGKGEKL